MALYEMPKGSVEYVYVDELPEKGEENKIYVVENIESANNGDWTYMDGVWEKPYASLSMFNTFFNKYQESVQQTIADLEQRVEELEGKGKILFEGSNIELIEDGATRGKWIDVLTDIEVTAGTVFHCTLTDMTIDGNPIEDASGDITAYQVPGWDWQGGELYDVPFGNGAYFAFGTEPKDAVAKQVTLGFVNEGDGFPVRKLVIGHLKVEVD